MEQNDDDGDDFSKKKNQDALVDGHFGEVM